MRLTDAQARRKLKALDTVYFIKGYFHGSTMTVSVQDKGKRYRLYTNYVEAMIWKEKMHEFVPGIRLELLQMSYRDYIAYQRKLDRLPAPSQLQFRALAEALKKEARG